MLKSTMLVWTSGLDAVLKAAAPHNPKFISIALPSLERTRIGRPPLSDCYTISAVDASPDVQLYQCFPESMNFPMHVDVWLIISDEVCIVLHLISTNAVTLRKWFRAQTRDNVEVSRRMYMLIGDA
jgi:hypothetical protein